MANISATAKAAHTVTAQEAAQGFCVVHISWPSPFYDTNYVTTWAIEDTGNLAGGPSLNLAPGDKHNVSPTGFDATVYLTSFPVVQAKLTKSNISAPCGLFNGSTTNDSVQHHSVLSVAWAGVWCGEPLPDDFVDRSAGQSSKSCVPISWSD